ncbi:MAG: DUF3971 domain-containing protein, partial [Caldimonas sp.]
GAPIRIGAITARSSAWVPEVELRDVRILDAEQRVALALPRVFAALSARSLLALEPRFAQLLIDGASLDIRKDKSGRIRVAGLEFDSAGGGGDDRVADWFFTQHEFVIRAGTLRWIDEQRDAPPLELRDVDLVVRNGLREHELRIDATPPVAWGDRLSLRGRFTQPLFARSGDWRRWSGRSYVELPRADLRELRRRVDLPFELSEGDGALRGWFDVKNGEPTTASLDVALRAVVLRLDKNVEPLAVEQVSGRIDAERKDDRTRIAVHDFAFRTGDGLVWPKGDLRASWRQADNGDVSAGEFDADRLDVGVMAEIASRVPIGAAVRQLLADVRPRGAISGLKTRWDGPLDAPTHYRVRGALSGLTLAAKPSPQADAIGRPGLSNASLELDANEGGGQAQVAIRAGAIDLPGVLAEHEVPLDRLDAKLTWKIEANAKEALPRITVKVASASFANADVKGELGATWHTGDGTGLARGGRYPGALELDGKLADMIATRTARYLPLGLPEGLRSYMAGAVRAGTIPSANFRIRGDLWDFPFHDAKAARDGEFRIDAKVEGVTFAYAPNEASKDAPKDAASDAPSVDAVGRSGAVARGTWPPLTAASGEIVVDRSTLEIRAFKARLANAEWSGLQGRIVELGSKARLDIEGVGRGPLADMLRFVAASPIDRWTGHALASATATGPAELRLAIGMPLARPAEAAVRGTLVLAGNDIRMTPDTPLLAAAKARVDFSQKGFAITAASARTLGGELAFEGGSSDGLNGGDRQRFSGRGVASAEALRQAGELGIVARVAGALSGQAAYRATLAFSGGRPQINVSSNLAGMAVDLPAPFAKAAATPLALRVRIGPEEAGPAPESGASARETLQLDLGGALQAHFIREVQGESTRVVRGAVHVGELRADRFVEPAPGDAFEPLVLPASGVAANIVLKRLDVDAWQTALARLQGEPARPGAPVATGAASASVSSRTAGTAPPLVFDASGGAGYVPDAISLRVGELAFGARRLDDVTAGLSRQGELWRANVNSDQLDGYIEYRPARRAVVGAGRVFARLSRLSLPKGEDERVESLLEDQPS